MPYLPPRGGKMVANSFSFHLTLSKISKKKQYYFPPPAVSTKASVCKLHEGRDFYILFTDISPAPRIELGI